MTQLDYPFRFTPIPTNLFLCLDNNCRSTLFTLVQLSTAYAPDGGWFFRTNNDLQAQTRLSHNVLGGALDALYKKGLIDIIPQVKGSNEARKYKVNFEKFPEYEKIGIEDCAKNPEYAIETCDYKHGSPSFQRNPQRVSLPTSEPPQQQSSLPTLRKSENNIDNRDNENNKEDYSIENLDNSETSISSSLSVSESLSPISKEASEVSGDTDIKGTENEIMEDNHNTKDSISTSTTASSFEVSSSISTISRVSSEVLGDSETPRTEQANTNPEEREPATPQTPSTIGDTGGSASQHKYRVMDTADFVREEFEKNMQVLYHYDRDNLAFDSKSLRALTEAASCYMALKGCTEDKAKQYIQSLRKEARTASKETNKDRTPQEEDRIEKKLIECLHILQEYDVEHRPFDTKSYETMKQATQYYMQLYNCPFDEAKRDIQEIRNERRDNAKSQQRREDMTKVNEEKSGIDFDKIFIDGDDL